MSEKKYQLCPKCQGQGTVSKPPYVPGDIHEWGSTTATSFPCNVCQGAKIIAQPCESPAEQPVVDELEHLRRWKMEAAELLTKINSYAHKHLEIKLGECAVEFVIDRCKELDCIKAEHPVRKEDKEIIDFIRDVATNWNCDEDGHKNNTGCRKCDASELLYELSRKTPAEWSGEKEGNKNSDPEWITWLSDQSPDIPDLTACTKEEKEHLVNALFQASGIQFMKMFYAIGLENMMESGMVNEATGDLFRLRFELTEKGEKEGKA